MSAYEAKVHSAIGNLYYNIGRVDDALEAFERLGNGFAALNMPFYAARSLGNTGVIHLAHQRFERKRTLSSAYANMPRLRILKSLRGRTSISVCSRLTRGSGASD